MIHGSMGREARLQAQEAFEHDPHVQVLLATDAAGEGINLQRAHLMVNYNGLVQSWPEITRLARESREAAQPAQLELL